MPAVGVMSLMPTGTPWSGGSASPRMTAASAARAAARARSAATVTTALTCGFARSIAARCASSTSTGLARFSRTSRASSRADRRFSAASKVMLRRARRAPP